MKVTIIFESNINEDGYDEVVSITRDGVEETTDLLSLYTAAAKAASFDYWSRTGYATDRGATHWEVF